MFLLSIFVTAYVFAIEEVTLPGILLAACSSISFAAYSVTSGQYQKGIVQARYPAFLFWLSVFSIPFILLLLPYVNISELPLSTTLYSALFVLIFSMIPYGLYFECMRSIKSKTLDSALPITLLVVMIGESIVHFSFEPFVAMPLLLALLWQYARRKQETT